MDETSLSHWSSQYDNATFLHPLAGAMLLIASIAVFAVPRRRVFLPIILLTVMVPAAQRINILGLDFHFMRLITVVAWLRVLARGEAQPIRMTALDWAMVGWTVARLVAMVLRRGTASALINQLGHGFDALGIYFLARLLIRNWRDVDALVTSFIWASLPVAALSVYEVWSLTNPFHVFEPGIEKAIIRDGRVRARGAFSHQILAGCYWAGLLPLVVGRLATNRGRILSSLGIASFLTLVYTCASSTPVLGIAIAMVGGAFWVLRKEMRWVRWGIVAAIVLVQLSMGKPIWHLLYRAGSLGLNASTGYHRYRLVQAFVDNFSKWALIGVNETGSWGRMMYDVTNHFLVQGVRGGLLTLVLFVVVYALAYRQNGLVVRAAESSRGLSIYAWSIGVAVLAHSGMMVATAYFGQILLPWYMTFGAIGSLSAAAVSQRRGVSRQAGRGSGVRNRAGPRGNKPANPEPSPGRLADLLR